MHPREFFHLQRNVVAGKTLDAAIKRIAHEPVAQAVPADPAAAAADAATPAETDDDQAASDSEDKP